MSVLEDKVEQTLEAFISHGNLGVPHDLDLARFYRFVIAAYEAKKTWGEADVRKELVGRRVPDRVAAKLANTYADGMLTLRTKDLVDAGDLSGFAKLEVPT